MQLCRIIYYSLFALHVSNDIFAHHLEHLNCITASGITHVCRCRPAATSCVIPEAVIVQMLQMMSENIVRNMQSKQGIINYPTQLHLVVHFRILYHDARKHEYQAMQEAVTHFKKISPDIFLKKRRNTTKYYLDNSLQFSRYSKQTPTEYRAVV